MEQAPVTLKYQFRQRLSAATGGFTVVFFGALVLTWAVARALFTAMGPFSALAVIVGSLVGIELIAAGIRHMTTSAAAPQLLVDNDRVIIDDTRVMTGMQSISLDRIHTIYVGPGVGDWLVGAYAEGIPTAQTQLARYPQLPNALVVLDEPVYMTRARSGLLRLWHLSCPPSPTRPTAAIWLTTDEADTFTVLMGNKGVQTHWVPAGAFFPGPSILDAHS